MTTALTISNLTKIYPNGLKALDDIHLSVSEGDFFALLGPNGAGKSTTIGIVSSLINKTQGEVKVFQHNIDTELAKAKACIGVVPQEMNFNPFEKPLQIVMNQAGYYGVASKVALARSEYYLKKLGLWEKRNIMALRLSGGMKRRLMIARALVNQPKLLILDEPTAGVDIELRHALWALLADLNKQGITIILTTHYLEEAEHLCKNVAIINHGKIIENTKMKTLINQLNVQTFILDLAKPMIEPPHLEDFSWKLIDEITMEVQTSKNQSLNNLFQALNQQKIEVIGMRNKTNRLEELFIRLTKAMI